MEREKSGRAPEERERRNAAEERRMLAGLGLGGEGHWRTLAMSSLLASSYFLAPVLAAPFSLALPRQPHGALARRHAPSSLRLFVSAFTSLVSRQLPLFPLLKLLSLLSLCKCCDVHHRPGLDLTTPLCLLCDERLLFVISSSGHNTPIIPTRSVAC